jgi:fructosamine-3-kinase
MSRRLTISALLAIALCVASCGGPMQSQELARSIQTLQSSAADGALLANGVARDRTKSTFVRVHSRELGEIVNHEAEKLSDASAHGNVAVRKSEAVDLASKISQSLGQLQVAPGDESGARSAEQQLRGQAKRASKLADSL